MSDFETIFMVKTENLESYDLLLQIWEDISEGSIEMTNKTNFSFQGFQCFVEDLMKDVMKIRNQLLADKKDITYQMVGKSESDDGELILFEMMYTSFEATMKAIYMTAEDDEEKYYEYASLDLNDISQKLKRNKFRTFPSIVEGKYLDFLIIYRNNGYENWMEQL